MSPRRIEFMQLNPEDRVSIHCTVKTKEDEYSSRLKSKVCISSHISNSHRLHSFTELLHPPNEDANSSTNTAVSGYHHGHHRIEAFTQAPYATMFSASSSTVDSGASPSSLGAACFLPFLISWTAAATCGSRLRTRVVFERLDEFFWTIAPNA